MEYNLDLDKKRSKMIYFIVIGIILLLVVVFLSFKFVLNNNIKGEINQSFLNASEQGMINSSTFSKDWCLANTYITNEEYEFFIENMIVARRYLKYNNTDFCHVFNELNRNEYYIKLDLSEGFLIKRTSSGLNLTEIDLGFIEEDYLEEV